MCWIERIVLPRAVIINDCYGTFGVPKARTVIRIVWRCISRVVFRCKWFHIEIRRTVVGQFAVNAGVELVLVHFDKLVRWILRLL